MTLLPPAGRRPLVWARRIAAAATVFVLVLAPSATATVATAPSNDQAGVLDPETVPMVQTSEDGARTEVLMLPRTVDPPAAQAAEQRRMRLAAYQPTGRFVRAGDLITVTTPTGHGGFLRAEIHVLGGGYFEPELPRASWTGISVPEGGGTFAAPGTGFLYFADYTSADPYLVSVTGGEPLPVWVLGHTTREDFDAQRARWPHEAVQLVTPRIWVDAQARWFDLNVGPDYDLGARVQDFDNVARWVKETYGLREDATGVHRSYGEMVHVVNSNSGAGSAYATHYYVDYLGSGGSGVLFSRAANNQWGLWHEIGHQYQHTDLMPSWASEVTVNLPALSIATQQFGLDWLAGDNLTSYRAWFALPVEERDLHAMDYGNANHFTRLRLYDQLLKTFGPSFFPRVMMEARVHRASGGTIPATDVAKMDHFAALASRVSGTDLREFFRQWGVPLSESTQAAMAASPITLTEPIWEVLSEADVRERIPLAPARAPDATLTSTHGTVLAGQSTLDADQLTLTATGSDPVSVERASVSAGSSTAQITAVITGTPDMVRDVLTTTANVVAPSDTIRVLDDGGGAAVIGFDAGAGRLRVLQESTRSPDGAVTITLFGADPRTAHLAGAGDLGTSLRTALGGAAAAEDDLILIEVERGGSTSTGAGSLATPGEHWFAVRDGALVPAAAPSVSPELSELQVDGGVAVADGAAAHRVTALVRDEAGRPVAGEQVTFTVTAPGLPGSAVVATDADGRAGLDVTSTGAGEVVVTANVGGQPVPGSGAVVRFASGLADASNSGWRLVPEGGVTAGEPATAEVTVRDAHGNPVVGAEVEWLLPQEVTPGAAGPYLTGTDGVLAVTLTAERAGGHPVAVVVGGDPIAGPAALVVEPAAVDLSRSALTAPERATVGDPGAQVEVVLHDCYGNVVTRGHAVDVVTTLGSAGPAVATAPGHYTTTLASAEPGVALVTFRVDGIPAGVQAAVAFDTSPVAAPGASPAPPGTLAATGTNLTPALALASGLVGAGVLLLTVRRSRTHRVGSGGTRLTT